MPFSFGYTKQRLTLENLIFIYRHIIIIAVRLKEDMDETKGPAFQLIFFLCRRFFNIRYSRLPLDS